MSSSCIYVRRNADYSGEQSCRKFTLFYAFIGCVPMLPGNRFTAFLILFAASVGPMTLYNVSWQAYFSDMVKAKEQNHIMTYRTALTFVIGIVVPFVSGTLLAAAETNDGKQRLHQIIFGSVRRCC